MAWTFNTISGTNWRMVEATIPFDEFGDEAGTPVLISTTNSSRQDGKRWMVSFEHDIEIPAATAILPQMAQVYLELDAAAFHGYDGSSNPLRWPLKTILGYSEDANDSHFQLSVNDTNAFLMYQGSADEATETIKKSLLSNTNLGELVDADLESLNVVVVLVGYGTGTPSGTPKSPPDTGNGSGIVVP